MSESKKVYLDNAATTPMADEVFEAMVPYMKSHFGNPSSTHSFGRTCKTAVEQARRKIAGYLNATASEIFFTSGGTEADNLALRSAVDDLGVTHIVTSEIEHSAVIKTAEILKNTKGIKVSYVNLHDDGAIDLTHLESLLKGSEKSLVSLMHGNNEIANLLPLKRVSEICRHNNAYFHSDTVQTMGHYHFDLQDVDIDFITCAGHKFHGPKGVGFLYINRDLKINPIISGGGQERQVRGGTENVYGIVGLAQAFDSAYSNLEEHQKHVSNLKQHMVNRLREELSGVSFNGQSDSKESLYTVLNVNFPPSPNAGMMLFLLDLEGVACSGGSACSSGAAKGSHVLEAINAIQPGRASLRFSFSRYTTINDIDFAVDKIKSVCELIPEDA